MYIPPPFAGPEPQALWEFMRANSFATLVSHLDGELFATHLPLLVRPGEGNAGHLVGHVARANPCWHDLSASDVLVVFAGPHAYISPRWYEAANVVPTWNYVAVHATGRCTLIDDDAEARDVLAEFVTTYESGSERPWRLDAEAKYFYQMAKQIVAFRIEVTRLEGKWKLSQNHPPERRANVARELLASADPQAQEIGRLMQQFGPQPPSA